MECRVVPARERPAASRCQGRVGSRGRDRGNEHGQQATLGTRDIGDMLKLLRRKSFRKSKDLNTEHSFAARRTGGPGPGATNGQYSVRQTERQRRDSGLQSSVSLNQSQEARDRVKENSGSLDRRQSRDNVRNLRYSSLASNAESAQPPEILQYARPPENLASPVRESNGYLAESSPVSLNPGIETTVQKLFFDSVVNGNISRKSSASNVKSSPVDKSPFSGGESSPAEPKDSVSVRESPGEAAELRTHRVTVREAVVSASITAQSHPYIRRSSATVSNNTAITTNNNINSYNNNNNNINNKPGAAVTKQNGGQPVRRSVMTALRQSFRKSKKDRPVVKNSKTKENNSSKVNPNPGIIPQNPLGRTLIVSRSASTEDHSRVSVASVRASRTLTPSRASIVSRGSLNGASRGSLTESRDQPQSRDQPPGSLITRASPARPTERDRDSGESQPGGAHGPEMKTVTSPGTGIHHGASHRASISNKTSAFGAQVEAGSSASARQPGQRFLPETPKFVASAGPPIYANVHQQLAAGNNRQMTPGIAKILEDTKRHTENGLPRSASGQSGSGLARAPSSEHRGPPAIPKPAARMSLRQKVGSEATMAREWKV